MIVNPVSMVLFPFTASSSGREGSDRTNALCRNALAVMAVVVGVGMLLIRPAVILLYGTRFLPVVPVFYAAAAGFLFWPVGQFLGVHIAAAGKPNIVFLLSLVTVFFTLACCRWLVPEYGAVGAGLCVTLVSLFQTLSRTVAYMCLTQTSLAQIYVMSRSDWRYYYRLLLRALQVLSLSGRGGKPGKP
jgi:O-antigen/teichoic acid export membrane protein